MNLFSVLKTWSDAYKNDEFQIWICQHFFAYQFLRLIAKSILAVHANRNHISVIIFFCSILLRLWPSLNNCLFVITQQPHKFLLFLGFFFLCHIFLWFFLYLFVLFIQSLKNQCHLSNQPMSSLLHWVTANKPITKDDLTFLWQFVATFKIHNRYINFKGFFIQLNTHIYCSNLWMMKLIFGKLRFYE